jgi:hypothetical protein
MTAPIDNPGSADAVARECTCDLIKNDFGRGKAHRDGVAFDCSETCPAHGVLKLILSPTTLFTYEHPTTFQWLKSRFAPPFKRQL